MIIFAIYSHRDQQTSFVTGPDYKCFPLFRLSGLCLIYSPPLLWHESSRRQYIKEWTWLWPRKTLFSKTGSWLHFAHGPQFANHCSMRKRLVNGNFPSGIIYIVVIPGVLVFLKICIFLFTCLFLNRSTQTEMSRTLELYHGNSERFV